MNTWKIKLMVEVMGTIDKQKMKIFIHCINEKKLC